MEPDPSAPCPFTPTPSEQADIDRARQHGRMEAPRPDDHGHFWHYRMVTDDWHCAGCGAIKPMGKPA